MADPAAGRGVRSVGTRVGAGLAVGVIVGIAVALLGDPSAALAAGWIAAAALFLTLTWQRIGRMDAADTAAHATREDPTITASHTIVLLAAVASLAGVVLLLAGGAQQDRILNGILGAGSVTASWFIVHTLYTLEYAALYYAEPVGGIDFNSANDAPDYSDFAYLGFTLGMTYQVSDTAISSGRIRRTALRHALLSYLLGAVVLGMTLNLVVGLTSSS